MAISIQVDKRALESTAETVNKKSQLQFDTLDDIKKTINNLQGSWASDAGEEIRAAITGMEKRFEQYKEVTDSYCQFLLKTAQAYADTENELTRLAGEFKF